MYNEYIEDKNLIYSVDMLRLKTRINVSTFDKLEFRLKTIWNDKLKKQYSSSRIKDFFYNYVVEDKENNSFWFGFLHNSEKRQVSDKAEYNFTIEFNPNKVKDNNILIYILKLSSNWVIKSFDLAIDIKVNILDLIVNYSGRHELKTISRGFDDKTVYLGKGDGRIKIYNKKRESKLDVLYDLTRVEISRELDDLNIKNISFFEFGDYFPKIYLNQYVYSLSDYKDKTLFALLYAVQNGFPLKDLSRRYKEKVSNLLQGGYAIEFSNKVASSVLINTILHYFNFLGGVYVRV